MRARLLGSALLIALIAVLALGIPLGIVGSSRARDNATSDLEREARGVAILVEEAVERGRPLSAARVEKIAPGHAIEIAMPGVPVRRIGDAVTGESLDVSTAIASGGTVTVRASSGAADHDATEVWLVVVLVGLGAFGVAALLALWLARRLSAPLEALAESSIHLGRPEFTVEGAGHGIPEVAALAGALERRADQIADLLARERAFSSNVAHQLRTPLTALSMRLEELAAADDRSTRDEACAALGQVERLSRTVDDLLTFARQGSAGAIGVIDVSGAVSDRARSWRPVYRKAGRELELDVEESVCAVVSGPAVEQALDVLLENALRHGTGRVTAGVHERAGEVVIRVADEGSGLTDEDAGRLFDGAGTRGLGLSLARALVEGCGGRLLLAATPSTAFEVHLLPAASPERGVPARSSSP